MTFKPSQATWFETYTPRNLTVFAIEALARSGVVELTHDTLSSNIRDADHIRSRMNQFNALAARFQKDLPTSLHPPKAHQESPEHIADSVYRILRQWVADFLRLKRKLASTEQQLAKLAMVKSLLESIPDHDLDFSWVERSSHVLYKKLFVCPAGKFSHPSGKDMFVEVFPADDRDFILALGTPEHAATVEAASVLVGCRELDIPSGIFASKSITPAAVVQKIRDVKKQAAALQSKIDEHRESLAIKESLAEIRLLNWYLENSSDSYKDHQLCHLIGWTTAASPYELEKSLEDEGIKARVFFSEGPVDRIPPVMIRHQWWVEPYSVFVNMAGALRNDEVDPAPFLAVIVPVLFGYMFPDVGHGLVLLTAGFMLRKRISQAAILIPCGLAAVGFGLLFGDVFGNHDFIKALWIEPLENPLQVLIAPLVMGAMLITTGLVFSAIEAYWRKKFRDWLKTEAAVLALYLVMIAGIFLPDALWLIPPVIAWYGAGTFFICETGKSKCLLNGFGHLLESSIRLVLNSISFVRVGAFALAHAGTSQAANQIAEMIENDLMVVVFLILSHVFIIVLEGLIVFVQTSRLILFEFFIRFLKADGRVFKPMHGLN